MGCGCKNKGNQQSQQVQQTPQVESAQKQVKTTNVQDSVKKIVEKYYRNK